MPDYIKFPLVLLIVCLISGSSLAFIYKITKPEIKAQNAKIEKEAEGLVFADTDKTVKKELNGFVYKEAQENGNCIGYIVKGAAGGYSSTVKVLAGVKKDFTVNGVKILSQNETPGLGTKIEEVKNDKTWMLILTGKKSLGATPGEEEPAPWFPEQFSGLKFDEIDLESGKIDAITGATISSRAVTEAVRNAVEGIKSALEREKK